MDRDSPHFEVELAIAADQLKISSISRDQAGALGAGCEGDKDVEVKVP